MSHCVYFMFAAGLNEPVRVPKGTLARIREHVRHVEATLKLQTERYEKNPPHWTLESKRFLGLDDALVCKTVDEHNTFVRWLYDCMAESKTRDKDFEEITPRQFARFLHALELLDVPPERWTRHYYRARMEAAYEVMRGRPAEGMVWDLKKPLTPEQAGAVIVLFSQWLDAHDLRLDVPWRCDKLASSYDGEYLWCVQCGAIASEDIICGREDEDADRCPRCRKTLD